jgi:glycosyltransferase involved in cell wall biosynthesis
MGKRFERFCPGARYKLMTSPFEIIENVQCNFDCSQFRKRDLLCLCAHYPHKNLEILIKVSKLLKKNNVETRFILTLNEDDLGVQNFLGKTRKANVDEYFYNIGVVDRGDVPKIFKHVEALILPTLMETFCLPLYEAMSHGLPVLVSDIDFAHDACGESGWYFDPKCAEAITECILVFFAEMEKSIVKCSLGLKRSNSLPTSTQVYDFYVKEIMNLIDKKSVC